MHKKGTSRLCHANSLWKEEKNAEKVSDPLELMGRVGICLHLPYSREQ